MSERTKQIFITPESQVLKQLRAKNHLSRQAVADKIGVSESYISQIEHGRVDFPHGSLLDRFLEVYGVRRKYFFELCTRWKKSGSDDDFFREKIQLLNPENKKLIREIMEVMLTTR